PRLRKTVAAVAGTVLNRRMHLLDRGRAAWGGAARCSCAEDDANRRDRDGGKALQAHVERVRDVAASRCRDQPAGCARLGEPLVEQPAVELGRGEAAGMVPAPGDARG